MNIGLLSRRLTHPQRLRCRISNLFLPSGHWIGICPSRTPEWRTFSSTFRLYDDTSIQITNTSEAEITSAKYHCTRLLQNYDNPSYTLLPFIPPDAQTAYLSLRALNISLAQISDTTSNPQVGALRCQFWRDAITSSLTLRPKKEPVALLLAHAAASLSARTDGRGRLSQPWLNRIVNEREKYLENPPYPTLGDLETYAENTYSTLLYLTLSALPMNSVKTDHVASHIGKAMGIVAVLRGLPLLAFPAPAKDHSPQTAAARGNLGGVVPGSTGRQGTVTLPLDIMAEAGVREEDVLRKGAEANGLKDAVFKVATRANDHLITAREMVKNLRAGKDEGHPFEHGDESEHQYDSSNHNTSNSNTSSSTNTGAGANEFEIEKSFGVYMPAVSTQMWLDKLQKVDFDIFDPALRSRDWKLPWKAYWAYNRRTF